MPAQGHRPQAPALGGPAPRGAVGPLRPLSVACGAWRGGTPGLTLHSVLPSRAAEDYTRVYVSHSRKSSQAVRTHSHTIRTLFAQSSHRIHSYSNTIHTHSHTVAHYSHGRTLFAHYSHSRTLFAGSQTIRTLFAGSHTIRTVHTLFAPSSHQICTLFAPVRTPVTLFARWGQARSHSFTQYSRQFAQFTAVRICECAIGTL